MTHKYFDINTQGHSIKCKLYTNDVRNIQKLVLFGHGFGGHKDNKAAERFANTALSKYKNVAVMTFNWPCHGDDVKKKLVLADCGTYISLILDYVRAQYNPDKLYVYATSFGGYLFLKYIAEHKNPFEKIALRCPAVKMYRVLTDSLVTESAWEKLNKGKEAAIGFDRKINITNQFLEDLKAADITKYDYLDFIGDILILQGTKDEVVNFDDVYTFADQNLIEFVPVENADHRFIDPAIMGAAIRMILEFFFAEE